jgi:hypothetical protein
MQKVVSSCTQTGRTTSSSVFPRMYSYIVLLGFTLTLLLLVSYHFIRLRLISNYVPGISVMPSKRLQFLHFTHLK